MQDAQRTVPGRYDHVVIGGGAIGTATAYWLTQAGGSTVLLEQYALGHDRGASEDHSRIIRHAYHSTDYTFLTDDMYAAWRHVEDASGEQLVLRTGGLSLAEGSAGEREIAGYAAALDAAGHAYTTLDAGEVRARWPQWRIGDDVVGLHQTDSGILDIRRANAAHVALARAGGATVVEGVTVLRLEPHADRVEVHTTEGVVLAGTVSVCAGSWTPSVLEGLGARMPITLTQEQVTYFRSPRLDLFDPSRFGIWIYSGAEHTHYGFPVYGEAAVKAGRDFSGEFVTQQTRRFAPDAGARDALAAFLAEHLPDAVGPELYSKTCVYDLTPDRHFVLDVLPGQPRIGVFVGAGHAAKFASLAGRVLADLAARGGTAYPVEAFRADRPALLDPAYPTDFRFESAGTVAATSPSAG